MCKTIKIVQAVSAKNLDLPDPMKVRSSNGVFLLTKNTIERHARQKFLIRTYMVLSDA